MKHAIKALSPWSPDISIISQDNTCPVDRSLLPSLQENPVVRRAFGRMFAYDLPAVTNGREHMATLISYEEEQFRWAKRYLPDGSPEDVQKRTGTGLIVSAPQYNNQTQITTGDTLTLTISGQSAEAGSETEHAMEMETEAEINRVISPAVADFCIAVLLFRGRNQTCLPMEVFI